MRKDRSRVSSDGETLASAKRRILSELIGAKDNASAVAQTATFAYDTSTGYLWYEPDGTGAASSRTLLAFLPGVPSLHAADMTVA